MRYLSRNGIAHRTSRLRRRFSRPLLVEALECRQLLTGAGEWYNSPGAAWFGDINSPNELGRLTAEQPLSRWIVRLDEEYSAAIGSARESWEVFYGATVLPTDVVPLWGQFRAIAGLGLPGQILVEAYIPADLAAEGLAALPYIVSVERERTIGGAAVPDDPQYAEQYGLNNTGQSGGTDDADIDAPDAWDLQTGSTSIVVAHIDSGIDYTHPDLAANIWTNPGEIAGNGLDDDTNGFIDDVHGYDFVNDDGDPTDDNGHGTHTAGTIAAVGDNGVGVTGVAWQASLMPLKFLDQNLKGTTSDAIQAFNYMTMMKTRATNPVNIVVSNNSWGFSGGIDVVLRQAVQLAGDAGILTVAAAGNGNALGIGINNDESPFFPASFAGNTIVSVAATDSTDRLLAFSNFGRTSVDIAAPGSAILSTMPGGSYGTKSGTSMATAHVTGVAALVYAEHPTATPAEVRQAILQGIDKDDPDFPGDALESLSPRLFSGGRLNALGALTAETFAPKAKVISAPNITETTGNIEIVIRYQDENGIDLSSIAETNIALARAGFSGESASASVVAIDSDDVRSVDVTYDFTPADFVFGADDAGLYNVVMVPNQVVNVNGLAAPPAVIGSFQIILSDPRVFIVDTTADSFDDDRDDGLALDFDGRTSLRAAIEQANYLPSAGGPVTIVLPDGIYPNTIGFIDVFSHIVIRGTGVNTTVLDARFNPEFELIPASEHPFGTPTVAPSLTLKDLAIINGFNSFDGGAVLVRGDADAGSELIIENCLLAGNSSIARGGAIASLDESNTVSIHATTLDGNFTTGAFGIEYGGGAIFNRGELNITASTISHNVAGGGLLATGGGGGVLHVGPGQFTLLISTISTNTANQSVGGGLSLAGPTIIDSTTITLNNAPRGNGGGIFIQPDVSVEISNNIIAENRASERDIDTPDLFGTVIDRRLNLIGSASGAIGLSDFDAVLHGTSLRPLSPELGPLQDNGGPTFTHDPLPGSRAIDSGFYFFEPEFNIPLVDQRGNERPNAGSIFVNAPDLGAVEKYGQIIRGTKFVDGNSDGIRQPNEPGLPGQTLFLDLNENSRLDPNEPRTKTRADDPATATIDESGQFELRDVIAGSILLSDAEDSGIIRQTPRAITSGLAPTFFKLADTVTEDPDTFEIFSALRAPVIGTDRSPFGRAVIQPEGFSSDVTVFFGEIDGFGTLFAAARGENGDPAVLGLETFGIPESILSYDFDGNVLAFTAGDGISDQAFLARFDTFVLFDEAVPVVGIAGELTGEVSVGRGLAAFPTLPDNIVLSALDPENPFFDLGDPEEATGIEAIDSGVFDAIYSPRVDSTTGDVIFATDVTPFGEGLWSVGTGDDLSPLFVRGFFDPDTFESMIADIRVVDANAGEVLISLVETNGNEGLYLLSRDGSNAVPQDVYFATPIADSLTPVPGGAGNFANLFDATTPTRGSLSNRSVAFGARDSAGEFGIYLKPDGHPLSKVISTTDTLEEKGIQSLELAEGTILDENRLAFLVEFDDDSRAIYLAEFSSASGYRLGIKDGRPDITVDFPSFTFSAEIHGIAFNDINRNAIKDFNEPGLSGRLVFLDSNGNGIVDLDETIDFTDSTGSYFFDELDPLRSYTVAIEPEVDEIQTAPLANDGLYFITPGPGEIVTGINFGLASNADVGGSGTGSKLTGSVLISNNGNGILAASSPRLPELLQGVFVFADQNGNGQFDAGELTSALDSGGQYSFSGLENANVQIRVRRKPGLNQTSPLVSNSFDERRSNLPVKPEGAAAGDFDHDGDAELAVTMSRENEVWIVRPDPAGAFTVIQKLRTHDYPSGVAVGDLNNDGWDDLIVGNAFGNDISVFVNQQNASAPFLISTPLHFRTQNVARPAGVPAGITVADFNNDQRLDIAVANSFAQEVAVFLNDSQGSTVAFHLDSRPGVGRRPLAVVAGQFSGSSALDLAVANNGDGTTGSSSVTILENNGQGKFSTVRTIQVAAGPTAIAVGHLNADSFADLVTTNYAANRITILWGRADGQFDTQEISAGLGPSSVVLVDVDNDGDQDIAISNGSDAASKNHLLVIRNQGGVFTAAEPAGSATFFPDAAFSVVVGNFDGVSGTDLALVNPILPTGAGNETGQLAVYFNQVATDGSLRVALETPREITGLNFELAFPRHNVIKALDVSGDLNIVAGDALDIINFLNAFGPQPVPQNLTTFGPFYDVNFDGTVSAGDALDVINFINAFGPEGEGEAAEGAPSTTSANERSDQRMESNDDLLALLALDVSLQPKRRR